MFFRVPKKKAGPDYKYHEVVRKRHERQKLEAYTCYQCEEVRIIKLQIVHFFRFLCTWNCAKYLHLALIKISMIMFPAVLRKLGLEWGGVQRTDGGLPTPSHCQTPGHPRTLLGDRLPRHTAVWRERWVQTPDTPKNLLELDFPDTQRWALCCVMLGVVHNDSLYVRDVAYRWVLNGYRLELSGTLQGSFTLSKE